MTDVRTEKRGILAEREPGAMAARAAKKRLARARRRCFWTRPRGHLWTVDLSRNNNLDTHYRCEVSGCPAAKLRPGF